MTKKQQQKRIFYQKRCHTNYYSNRSLCSGANSQKNYIYIIHIFKSKFCPFIFLKAICYRYSDSTFYPLGTQWLKGKLKVIQKSFLCLH